MSVFINSFEIYGILVIVSAQISITMAAKTLSKSPEWAKILINCLKESLSLSILWIIEIVENCLWMRFMAEKK